ncbi:MAG: hypothetical protein FWD32_00590 [Firmicutes bacterium]|nr:hypothetical protein [Bacillota bacterium]
MIVTDISVLSADERLKLKNRYEANLETLRERLRINERQLKLNNKDYIPLRRVKNSLERDKKQLRRREAIVAKQQVLVYGVNNKMNLDPERIKKLEEDTQQLEGLQKSVTSCEEIMYRNRDRYPTLENMYNILTTQGKNIKADIEELEARIAELGKIEMDNTVILDNKNDEEN